MEHVSLVIMHGKGGQRRTGGAILMSCVLDDKTYIFLLGKCDAREDIVDAGDIDRIAGIIPELTSAVSWSIRIA